MVKHRELRAALHRSGLSPALRPQSEQWPAFLEELSSCWGRLARDRQLLELSLSSKDHELQALREALLDERERLEALLACLPSGLVWLDADGCVQLMGAEAERLLSRREAELAGQSLGSCFESPALLDSLRLGLASRGTARLKGFDQTTRWVNFSVESLGKQGCLLFFEEAEFVDHDEATLWNEIRERALALLSNPRLLTEHENEALLVLSACEKVQRGRRIEETAEEMAPVPALAVEPHPTLSRPPSSPASQPVLSQPQTTPPVAPAPQELPSPLATRPIPSPAVSPPPATPASAPVGAGPEPPPSPPSPQAAGDAEAEPDWIFRPLKILLVEDEPISKMITQEGISGLGHECLLAEDGIEAMKLLVRNPVDAVISSYLMPGMNGLELCRRIREDLGLRCYFIVLTAHEASLEVGAAAEAGADAVIAKPFDVDDLAEKLRIAQFRIHQEIRPTGPGT